MRIAVHDYAGHPFVFELSRQLARDGHTVCHFYFEGDPGPKGETTLRPDDAAGFSIQPIAIAKPYRKDKLFQRRAQDIEYGHKAAAHISAFKPDVLICGQTPLEALVEIHRAMRKAGTAFVFWMQDFYSLAVREILGKKLLGAGALVAAWYEHLETRLLNDADAIVLISEDFHAGLAELHITNDRLTVIPNWGALDAISVGAKVNPWSEAMGLSDKFVFLYSGTLGLKHDPSLLLALADDFVAEQKVEIVVAAIGAGAESLARDLAVKPRANLRLKGLEPLEALPQVLGAADIMIALLDEDAGRYSVPSKVLSYLCAAKPILLSAPTDNLSARVLKDAEGGLSVRAGDAQEFVQAARSLYADAALRAQMGLRARAYAEATFDIAQIAKRFEGVFADVISRK